MKQSLFSVIVACGLATASATAKNNTNSFGNHPPPQTFELTFPKSEPTKDLPWTVKVVLSRINTKKSRFTGPTTANATVKLTGNKKIENQPGASTIETFNTTVPQPGPYNAVTFDLDFGDKYTGTDKRIVSAIADAQDMIQRLMIFNTRVECILRDEKGYKIALSPDPSGRSWESPIESTAMVESSQFQRDVQSIGTAENQTKPDSQSLSSPKPEPKLWFFVWGTQTVANVSCESTPSTAMWATVEDGAKYHVTLEDKSAGDNMTSPRTQSFTKLAQAELRNTESIPSPPGDVEIDMFRPVFPLPLEEPSNGTLIVKPEDASKGKLSELKSTALGVMKKKLASASGAKQKQEYSTVKLEIGEVLQPKSRCQILDATGKAISVEGKDGKAATTFGMGVWKFHEPKRSTVGKIVCGAKLGQ